MTGQPNRTRMERYRTYCDDDVRPEATPDGRADEIRSPYIGGQHLTEGTDN